MTQSMNITLTCPNCGAQDEAEIWTSVNSAESPDVAQWLIDGFLFEHECPACGNISTLNHDCLYHDPAHRMLVQYVTDESKLEATREALEAQRASGYHARIVTSRYTLREKAAILRDNLDDHAVEFVKFLVYNKFVGEKVIDVKYTAYYGALDEDGGIIVEFIGPDEPLETTVPRDVYEGALEQIGGAALDDADPLVVDRAWAAKLYQALG